MASIEAKECSICKEEYDELQRCPRILPCAHCICTQCINDLIIRNDKKCPFCRKTFVATSAQEFGINIIFLDLLKLVKEIEDAPINPNLRREQIVEAIKKNNTHMNIKYNKVCQEETDHIREMINDNNMLKKNILRNHCILMEDITHQIKDLDARFLTEMEYLDVQNQRLEDRLKELEAKNRELEDVKQGLDAVTSFRMLDNALNKAEAFNVSSQTWFKKIKMKMSKEEEIRQGIKENLEYTSTLIHNIKKVLESPAPRQRNFDQQREAIMHLDNIAGQLTMNMLQYPSPAIKYLAILDGIYAIQKHAGIERCSKISFSWDQKIWVHCLTRQELPQHVVTIKHDDVMEFVNPSSRTTFLEFGTSDLKLGRILISLTPETKKAQNFSLLCSGINGPSYLNTVLYDVCNKGIAGEGIMGGDYEYGNGTGGKALVPGAGDENGGVLKHPNLAGFVGGITDDDIFAAQFWITTRDDPDTLVDAVFGKVESGLHVVSDAIANYPKIKEVRIFDCGVVLSLS